MKKIFVAFTYFIILCSSTSTFAQLIQSRSYYIPTVQPYATVYESQEGTALSFLNDNGIAIGGQIVYITDPYGNQLRPNERQFFLKIDSLLNYQWADTFELLGDFDPSHIVNSVIQLSDSGIIFDTDTIGAYKHTVLRKNSVNGSRIWNKFVPSDSLNEITCLSKCINHNDTLIFSGYAVNAVSSRPILIGTNINGDTIFFRDYSAYTSFVRGVSSYIYEDLFKNLYVVLKSSYGNVKILKVDNTGNVISVDSIAMQDNFEWRFLFISPSKFLLLDDHYQLYFHLLDFNNTVLDSFNIGCAFNRFSLGKNGDILALGTTNNNPLSPLPPGNYLLDIDTTGQFKWAIRYNQIDSGAILNVVKAYDDSTFFGTGRFGNAFNTDLLLMKFHTPIFNRSLGYTSNTICGGDSILIQAPSGYNYKWSTGDSLQNIYVHQAGNYFVLLSDSSGAFVFSDTVSISLLPNIYLGNDTTLCNTQTILLDAGNGFINYLWQDSTLTQTFLATGSTSVGIDTLNYFVSVTDSNSCTATDTVQIIFEICAGINSISENNFTIQPNPSDGKVKLLNNDFEKEKSSATIFNATGRKLFSIEVKKQTTEIDLTNYPSGIYFIELKGEKTLTTKKLIKL